MKEFELPQELIFLFKEISKTQTLQQRQAKTMLEGFIATKEHDIYYMDKFMDPLYDFIEAGSDTEEVIRKYIGHIATFDSKEAAERTEWLEDDLGYKTLAVYAAGILAQRLHAGQKDKGGNDYFSSHLLKVAEKGFDWKEKVTGFLHDTTEDCGVTVDDVMDMLDHEIERLINEKYEFLENAEWWQYWMEEIMPYPASETHPITETERKEISEALMLLNHNSTSTREEYISRFEGHKLAIRTKLNDLENNLDISRIPAPTQKDLQRIERYKNEQSLLQKMLRKSTDKNNCSD